jgi:hypothetical protein
MGSSASQRATGSRVLLSPSLEIVDFGWRLHPKSILFTDLEVEVFMTTIIRDALAPECDRVALLAVGAYQEYA